MSIDKQVTGLIKTILSSSLFIVLLIVVIAAWLYQIKEAVKENYKPDLYHYAGRCISEGGEKRVSGTVGLVFQKSTVTDQFEELQDEIQEETDCQYPNESKLFIQNIKELKLGN